MKIVISPNAAESYARQVILPPSKPNIPERYNVPEIISNIASGEKGAEYAANAALGRTQDRLKSIVDYLA